MSNTAESPEPADSTEILRRTGLTRNEPSLQYGSDELRSVVRRPRPEIADAQPGELVLGSDNGSAFTARRFRAKLAELGIRHRRGGYRDPESQAFIESWSGNSNNGRCG